MKNKKIRQPLKIFSRLR